MSQKRVAAIDQGTTSTRVLVVDERGGSQIVHALRHTQHHPRPGWVEHDPLELLRNVSACVDAAGPVDALGIDNQGESCLAWDAETGDPLSPVIVWQDKRTGAMADTLRADGAESLTLERAGLPLDPYFSATKLGWILANVPEARRARERGRLRLGTTDAFFLDRLAGRYVTDATTASRTSLMKLETLAWDETLCELFGVPIECLPTIVPSAGHVIGAIGRSAVTAAIVDQQAALFGHGCRASGDAKITFGTGAFALAVTGDTIVRAPEIGLLPTVAWQIGAEVVYAVDGGVYDAGAVVEWLRRIGIVDKVDALRDFSDRPAIDAGLVFVPALSGLACPWWDRSAAGLWLGMTAATTRSQLAQSALEGIALCTAQVVDAMSQRIPITAGVSIDGGLSRSPYFSQFLADSLDRTVRTSTFDELTSYGCARMAALAVGADIPARAGTPTDFEPRENDGSARHEKFGDAVERARNWF